MVKGTTTSGFKFEIDERLAGDYRLLEAITVAEDEKASDLKKLKASFDIIEFILGDQKEAFIEHIKATNDGFVPFEVVKDEVSEIIANSRKIKN